MRIALVCGTFQEGWGYQENSWAEELLRGGHTVRVFAAGSHREAVRVSLARELEYEVCRLPSLRLPHAILLSSGLREAVAQYEPDLILLFGAERLFFGHSLLSPNGCETPPIISFFGLNRGMHEFDWSKAGISLRQRLYALGWRLLRGSFTRRVCCRSHLIVATVPETRTILDLLFSRAEVPAVDSRIVDLPLGFSPQVYQWNPAQQSRVRRELGIKAERVVACFSCRFGAPAKEKRNARTLMAIRCALAKCPWLHGIFVGFGADEVSTRLKQIVQDPTMEDRVHCLPFSGQERLNQLYNAADLAIFPNCSISCQAALGTGLTVCLANNGTMDHLIREPSQACFFDPYSETELAESLAELAQRLRTHSVEQRNTRRTALSEASRWLGYDRLAATLLETIASRTLEESA
jgi:glycosyltransferase involved in cell wall biosynthesis